MPDYPKVMPLASAPIPGEVMVVDMTNGVCTVNLGAQVVDNVTWYGLPPKEGDTVLLTDTGTRLVINMPGAASSGDGGGLDEVWVGPDAPAVATQELWVDTDEDASPLVTMPTIHATWSVTSWAAATHSQMTLTSVNANLSTVGYTNHFNDLATGKTYLRVTQGGLYMFNGQFNCSWPGDSAHAPVNGVARLGPGSYMDFQVWCDTASGSAAHSLLVNGADNWQVIGSVYLPAAIGGAPTSMHVEVAITRIGD